MTETLLVVLLVCVGMSFSVLNGMNDISGIIAPLVATRALSVLRARLVALCGIFTGILFAHASVSQTVAWGLVDLSGRVDPAHALAAWLGGVAGALLWGVAARRMGVPTSATHAFIGALCGSTLAATGQPSLVEWGVDDALHGKIHGVMKVAAGLLLSPLVGSGLGYLFFKLIELTLRRASHSVNDGLRKVQCAILLGQTFCYGSNDAQNVMGAITGALISGAFLVQSADAFAVPVWVKLLNIAAISVGVLIGSGSIVRTVGQGLIQLTVAEAASGQAAEAASVLAAATLGAPVSSTQVLSSAIVGAGAAFRPRHVRWKKVREILLTWLITFPAALLIGGLLTLCIRFLLEVLHG